MVGRWAPASFRRGRLAAGGKSRGARGHPGAHSAVRARPGLKGRRERACPARPRSRRLFLLYPGELWRAEAAFKNSNQSVTLRPKLTVLSHLESTPNSPPKALRSHMAQHLLPSGIPHPDTLDCHAGPLHLLFLLLKHPCPFLSCRSCTNASSGMSFPFLSPQLPPPSSAY